MATTLPERADVPGFDVPSAATVESTGRNRRGRLGRKLLLVVLVAAGAGLAGFAVWTLASDVRGPDQTLVFYTVKRADLPIKVTENGSLQSQKTTEIRCEVENVGYERQGTQILTIVPAGEDVKEGDLLVELDSALIQDRLDTQELATEKARSQQIQADAKLENRKTQNETNLAEAELKVKLAQLTLEQYEDEDGGTFQLDLQLIDLAIQEAELKRLINATNLAGIEELKKLGYRSKGQLEGARLQALSADKQVATQVSLRKELVEYTYKKEKMTREGAVATAKRALEQVKVDNAAQLMQAEAAKNEADRLLEKEEEKLAKYKEQLVKCKIYAPHDGMVTYATENSRYSRSRIEEGATVHQRQRIITLPDLSVMEVKTTVHESVLDWIQEGLPATITVEAFPERKYKGSVKSVAVLADAGEWHSSDVKVYTTIVTIDEKVERLKPGMSAVVDIHVERVEDVLSLPVQAVVQVAEDNWCYVDENGKVELRKVTLGKTNEKFVEIREGLKEGERVVLNPMSLVDEDEGKGNEINPEGDSDEGDVYGIDGDNEKPDESPSNKPAAGSRDTEKKPASKGRGRGRGARGGGSPKE
ncbi:MAG: efflux RND transporter periplasmic adaptor subunit [Pirellulaceae bacterium]|nr:efflux RND transporter periplasmic adaptor subunit [Pirellulaceae bacterium]